MLIMCIFAIVLLLIVIIFILFRKVRRKKQLLNELVDRIYKNDKKINELELYNLIKKELMKVYKNSKSYLSVIKAQANENDISLYLNSLISITAIHISLSGLLKEFSAFKIFSVMALIVLIIIFVLEYIFIYKNIQKYKMYILEIICEIEDR